MQANREAETLRRRVETLVPREDLKVAVERVRELEALLAARQPAAASMVPATALAASQEEVRRLRETCGRLEEAARRTAQAEDAAATARKDGLAAAQEARRLKICLEGAVPRSTAENVERQLEGMASELAWLRRLVASMDQVLVGDTASPDEFLNMRLVYPVI